MLLYEKMKDLKIDVLLDERPDVSSGTKFRDAALIGIPKLLIVGKNNFTKNKIDIEFRNSKEKIELDKDNITKIMEVISEN